MPAVEDEIYLLDFNDENGNVETGTVKDNINKAALFSADVLKFLRLQFSFATRSAGDKLSR